MFVGEPFDVAGLFVPKNAAEEGASRNGTEADTAQSEIIMAG